MSARTSTPRSGPVTRDDLEAKLGELREGLDEDVQELAGLGKLVAAGAVAVIIVAVFLWGRRRGRRRTTLVEIRRL